MRLIVFSPPSHFLYTSKYCSPAKRGVQGEACNYEINHARKISPSQTHQTLQTLLPLYISAFFFHLYRQLIYIIFLEKLRASGGVAGGHPKTTDEGQAVGYMVFGIPSILMFFIVNYICTYPPDFELIIFCAINCISMVCDCSPPECGGVAL